MMDGPVAALHGDSREPMHWRCDRGSGLPMKRGGAAQGRTSVDNTGQRNDAACSHTLSEIVSNDIDTEYVGSSVEPDT
jgi:hypothetical protein